MHECIRTHPAAAAGQSEKGHLIDDQQRLKTQNTRKI